MPINCSKRRKALLIKIDSEDNIKLGRYNLKIIVSNSIPKGEVWFCCDNDILQKIKNIKVD